jgi:hypothetical protein
MSAAQPSIGPWSKGSSKPNRSASPVVLGPIDAATEAKRIEAARKRVGKAGRRFFDDVMEDFTGWAAPDLELLVRAAQVTDRIEEARAAIASDGLFVEGARGGTVRHPGVLVEQAALSELRALLKALALDLEVD